MMTAVQKIQAAFAGEKPAFMPYFTLGYPDFETSLDIIEACVQSGAGLMELGIPFSDPLADGPTIQYSTQTALKMGMNVSRCLAGVGELRRRGISIPLVLMGYVNPMLAYGLDRFVRQAARVGADGLIIPDIPPEEAGELEAACRDVGLALIYLLAPNSSLQRIQLVCERSTGFTYLVSVTGVTGSRSSLPAGLGELVRRVRPHTGTPLAVGFGISTPEQALAVGELVEGVIVGSALIRVVRQALENSEDAASEAGRFVQKFSQALNKETNLG